MKKFKQLRESVVINKKMNKRNVKIVRNSNKFKVLIDNEELDTFNSLKDGLKAVEEFIKQAG